MKHNKIIVMITAIVLLVSSIGVYGNTLFFNPVKGQVSTVISFNFPGVDEGLNPHGGSFDIQRFKNDEVVVPTIEELGLEEQGITPELLAKHISLKGYVPKDVLERILPKASGSGTTQMQDVSGMSYHPTQYVVTLNRTSELKLSKKEATVVVDKLIQNYQTYFLESYKDTQSLESAITKIDVERYDYSEYILLAEGQLEIMNEYLLAKEQVAKGFKSTMTGLTFSDLIAQVELLQDIEINNVKALVDTFMITKNQSELQSVYENRIVKLGRERDQILKEKNAVNNALKDYQKDPTVILDNGTVVSSPYIDEEKEIALYETLVQQSIDLETKHNSISSQIEYYQELLNKIYAYGEGKSVSQAYLDEVESTTKYISDEIDELVSLITQTTDEYYEEEVFAESVTRTAPIIYKSAFKIKFIKNTLVVGLITGFGLLLSIMYVLIKQIREKK